MNKTLGFTVDYVQKYHFYKIIFFIFSRYALNHPVVSYCQGMSDLASPLLVTMNDEAHAYICFCSLMSRLSPNFLLDGITMTQRFQHLAEGLMYYDNTFYNYLKSHQVSLLNIIKVEMIKINKKIMAKKVLTKIFYLDTLQTLYISCSAKLPP